MSDDKYKAGGHEFQPGRMEKSFDQWVDEERAEHNMSDDTTEGDGKSASGGGAVNEVVAEPGPKSPADMVTNPKDAINTDVLKQMGR